MKRMNPAAAVTFALFAACAVASGPARAETSETAKLLREVRIDQSPGTRIPADARFFDASGDEVRLGDLLQGRPAVLAPVDLSCKMLCERTLHALAHSLAGVGLDAGTDFDVIVVSFDPRETPADAAKVKADLLHVYGRGEGAASVSAGWHVLTGAEPEIEKLMEAIGFHYRYLEKTDQYAHPAGVVLLSPDGTISRYLLGIDYAPRDLRLGLVEASDGEVGTPVDRALLLCYHYDPESGTYGFAVMRTIRALALLTVLGLGGFIFLALRRGSSHGAQT